MNKIDISLNIKQKMQIRPILRQYHLDVSRACYVFPGV